MSDAQSSPIYADDEIDIRELFAILWEGKLFIASCTGLAAMLSVIVPFRCQIFIGRLLFLLQNLMEGREVYHVSHLNTAVWLASQALILEV